MTLEAVVAMAAKAVTSPTLWTAIQALGTLAAFWAVWRQFRNMQDQTRAIQATTQATQQTADAARATTAYDLLFRLDARFDSPRTSQRKKKCDDVLKAALALPDGAARASLWAEHRGDVENVIDEFELMGLLVRRKVIDAAAMWSLFSYSIANYYAYCQKSGFFDFIRASDPSFYEDFLYLHDEIQEVQRARTGRMEEPDPIFLDPEPTESSDSQLQSVDPRGPKGKRAQ